MFLLLLLLLSSSLPLPSIPRFPDSPEILLSRVASAVGTVPTRSMLDCADKISSVLCFFTRTTSMIGTFLSSAGTKGSRSSVLRLRC
ncbi:hypothetical protein BZA05DRAFT_387284 [Tricharina praecox]|uniref:uncharacterized protein n=1 Tax=Tricharina praecox TaxID=43433 RepID=UPI002220BE73|nr:uncharacterized protein BZA05DRAFT_387284 [Tricharina praecox]KAI5857109.1 hypothetical protein BZA05DRAFT_387284 [Tricharina praecox]